MCVRYFLSACFIFLQFLYGIRTAHAQLSFEAFMYAGPEEASALTEAYMEPVMLGLSYGMANGWYNTAATHKPLGFDVSLTTSACLIPSSYTHFSLGKDVYQNIYPATGNGSIPTAIGPKDGTDVFLSYTDESTGISVQSVQTIGGAGLKDTFGYNMIPTPVVQLGVGTFWNTDIIVRYMPGMKRGDVRTSLFGLGIKHDIRQWVPALQRLPVDIALLAAFSGFDNRMDMADRQIPGSSQETVFDINGWTVQGIFSREFSIITLYGAIGYGSVSSSLRMLGTYQLAEGDTSHPNALVLVNPVQLCYKEGVLRATAGFRMKLGIFSLHGDYTYQKFHSLSTGLGFSFR
jgi:hypothetical protein